jgi:hypothetical protein
MRHSKLVHIMVLGFGNGFKNELLRYKTTNSKAYDREEYSLVRVNNSFHSQWFARVLGYECRG